MSSERNGSNASSSHKQLFRNYLESGRHPFRPMLAGNASSSHKQLFRNHLESGRPPFRPMLAGNAASAYMGYALDWRDLPDLSSAAATTTAPTYPLFQASSQMAYYPGQHQYNTYPGIHWWLDHVWPNEPPQDYSPPVDLDHTPPSNTVPTTHIQGEAVIPPSTLRPHLRGGADESPNYAKAIRYNHVRHPPNPPNPPDDKAAPTNEWTVVHHTVQPPSSLPSVVQPLTGQNVPEENAPTMKPLGRELGVEPDSESFEHDPAAFPDRGKKSREWKYKSRMRRQQEMQQQQQQQRGMIKKMPKKFRRKLRRKSVSIPFGISGADKLIEELWLDEASQEAAGDESGETAGVVENGQALASGSHDAGDGARQSPLWKVGVQIWMPMARVYCVLTELFGQLVTALLSIAMP
ncbi:uncharacterized protein BKCO1_2000272 [Diplodia corticola]|uniref:Uncharacterized protein n=1 Tax=Diplodia corticola TaxID=236234 RepID=A0A1J9S4W1_9PEZI|nr:uncharacterized protein BKCO1_2000272 [Diplodia corticola]OJD39995.1 hypothetical protein BKCO1_2000272 [Diplodia corticola]